MRGTTVQVGSKNWELRIDNTLFSRKLVPLTLPPERLKIAKWTFTAAATQFGLIEPVESDGDAIGLLLGIASNPPSTVGEKGAGSGAREEAERTGPSARDFAPFNPVRLPLTR